MQRSPAPAHSKLLLPIPSRVPLLVPNAVASSHSFVRAMVSQTRPSELVRATARYVASHNNSHVKVDEQACEKAASFLFNLMSRKPHTYASVSQSWCFANRLHPYNPSPNALNWIFTVDTLNFCFWTPTGSPPFTVEYNSTSYTGYWALCAAINRALDEDIPITDPSFYATVDKDVMDYIFRSSTPTPIPLLEERVRVLNEAGTFLRDKFHSSTEMLLHAANGSAQALVHILVSNLTSFNDSLPVTAYPTVLEATTCTAPRLCFYKRAQILAADVWACYASTKRYRFYDIDQLTMFADYRVPQTLAWLGAIKYTDSLLKELRSGAEMASGSRHEIEIRACSIHAVELIKAHLEMQQHKVREKRQGENDVVPINSILIDYLLWDYAKAHEKDLAEIPVHHVKSIYY